jgi:hypothetical protein
MMTIEDKKKKPRFKAGVDLSAKVNITQSSDADNTTIMRIWFYVKSKLLYQKSQD